MDKAELLKAIKEGNEAANKERVKQGFKALRIDGWSEPPAYRKEVHHMVWALLVSDDDGASVNYNTRVLGRRGYVSLNLVTNPKFLEQHRPVAVKLLAATQFGKGARYEDFDKSKGDKVADYTLAALVGGGALAVAAKMGILQKFWKFIVVGVLAVLGAVKKLFKRRPKTVQDAGVVRHGQ